MKFVAHILCPCERGKVLQHHHTTMNPWGFNGEYNIGYCSTGTGTSPQPRGPARTSDMRKALPVPISTGIPSWISTNHQSI